MYNAPRSYLPSAQIICIMRRDHIYNAPRVHRALHFIAGCEHKRRLLPGYVGPQASLCIQHQDHRESSISCCGKLSWQSPRLFVGGCLIENICKPVSTLSVLSTVVFRCTMFHDRLRQMVAHLQFFPRVEDVGTKNVLGPFDP